MAPNVPADERFGPKHYFLKEYDSKSSALKEMAQNCTGLARVILPKSDFMGRGGHILGPKLSKKFTLGLLSFKQLLMMPNHSSAVIFRDIFFLFEPN
jgi:hypothetical protein